MAEHERPNPEEVRIIIDELGIGAIDAERIAIIHLEAAICPAESALAVEKMVVVGSGTVTPLLSRIGFKSLWVVLKHNCYVHVGELGAGKRVILDVEPLPIH